MQSRSAVNVIALLMIVASSLLARSTATYDHTCETRDVTNVTGVMSDVTSLTRVTSDVTNVTGVMSDVTSLTGVTSDVTSLRCDRMWLLIEQVEKTLRSSRAL